VHQVGEPVAAARPRFDPEPQLAVLFIGVPLDLTRLEVTVQRREAEGGGRHVVVPQPLARATAPLLRFAPRSLELRAVAWRFTPRR